MFKSLIKPGRTVISLNPVVSSNFQSFRIVSNGLNSGRMNFSTKKEEEPLPPSLAEKYNLYDPTRWVPITVGAFGLATVTGIYHWDAESQMLGLFVVFCATVYSQVGPSIGKMLDDMADEVQREQTEAEDKRMSSIKSDLAHSKQYVSYDSDVNAMVSAQKKLEEDLREAIPHSFETRKNAFFKSKLDRIITIETEARESLQHTLINKATEKVTNAFKNEKALQDKTLQTALNWLQAPEGEKKELTEVGDEFKKFFAKAKKDPTVTKEIETKMKASIDRVLGEKFDIVDEYQYLKSAN